MALADVVLLALMGLAALRGLWIGLTRELLSLAALAGLCIALRVGFGPVSDWLEIRAGLGSVVAGVAAVLLLLVAGLLAVGLVRAILRRALDASGLGFWDRLLGGLLGTAEGALVAALLVLLAAATLGREHPLLADSRALAAFERAERFASRLHRETDVAAPPRR